MGVTDDALFINDDLGWDPPKFKQVDFLFVLPGSVVVGVRQSDEGDLCFLPKIPEGLLGIWTDCDDLCVSLGEPLIILAQLRHVPAAEWSGKAPVEDQEKVFLSFEFRKGYGDSTCVYKG